MSARSFETQLIISARDNTSGALSQIIRHIDQLAKTLKHIERADRASKPLEKIAHQSAGIEKSARALDKMAHSLDRMARASAGLKNLPAHLKDIAHISGGLTAFHGVQRAVPAAVTLQGAITQFKMGNQNPEELKQALEKSAALSAQYPAVPQAEIMNMIRVQRGVTGSFHEALSVIDDNVRLRQVASAVAPGHDIGDGMEQLNKALEIAGVTQDPARHHRYMDSIAKMIQTFPASSLKFEDIAQVVRKSTGAAKGWSEEFFAGTMPTLSSILTGNSAGNAISTAYSAIVAGRMKQSAIVAMQKYGLVDKSKIIRTKTGATKGLQAGGVKGWQLFQQDPYRWAHEVLEPPLTAKGAITPEQREAAIAQMFSDRHARFLMSTLLGNKDAHGHDQFQKDRELIKGSEGLASADLNKERDAGTAISGVTGAFTNFLATITSPLVNAAIPALNLLAERLNAIGKAAQDNPLLGGALGVAGAAGAAGAGVVATRSGISLARSILGTGGAAETAGTAGAAETAGAATAAGSAWARMLGAAGGVIGRAAGPLGAMYALGEELHPMTPQSAPYRLDTAWPTQREDLERSRREQIERHQGANMEGVRGLEMLRVQGEAKITSEGTFKVEIVNGNLRPVIEQIVDSRIASVQLQGAANKTGAGSTGRSSSDAAAPAPITSRFNGK